MVAVTKPIEADIPHINAILSQWTDRSETEKYTQRIQNEIKGHMEYNIHFWVAKRDGVVVGVIGLSDILPIIACFVETEFPQEVKILYVDGAAQGTGVGRELINFIEKEALRRGATELLVRSAARYKFSAYGFYEKMGYSDIGEISPQGADEKMQVFRKKL